MAKFTCQMSDASGGHLAGEREAGEALSSDDLLEVLRPAGLKLKEYYQNAIRTRFKQRTGSLADSFNIKENNITSRGYASITVKPFGKHEGSFYARRKKPVDSSKKDDKPFKKPVAKAMKNEELLYFLEYGTPRISATHIVEKTNEQVSEEIQDLIESGYDDLLKKKGLI